MKKYLNKISLSGGAMNVTKALEGYITSDALTGESILRFPNM